MSKLEKWLPFKFKKKNPTERGAVTQPPAEDGGAAGLPAQAPGALVPFASLLPTPMHQLMQTFFNDPFFREPFGRFEPLERWFGDFSPRRFTPSVEVSDDGKAIRVTAELPGMDKEDVELQIEGGSLVISGEKKSSSESSEDGTFRTERYYGYFRRIVPLPEDIDHERADAEFKKGVLTIRFPKLESASSKSRQIPIKG